MSDFFVTLPSHSSKNEFPENKANSFKLRLPNPIRLEGHGWKVGLFSIAMPDAHVTLPSFTDSEDKVTLAYTAWRRVEPGTSNGHSFGVALFNMNDIKEVFSNVNGVEFMKSILGYFERERIFKYSGPRLNARYVTSDGKRTYVAFKWEGEDLVTDNKDILRPRTDRPALRFNVDLALKMGWIKMNGNSYVLGPNLRIEFFDDVIPDIRSNGDLFDSDGNAVFFLVVKNPLRTSDFLRLSIFCNWHFLNLNKAFESVIGSISRSLLVYSNVGGGSVVGNQVTDLLREVNLIRRGAGVQYFEPTHSIYSRAQRGAGHYGGTSGRGNWRTDDIWSWQYDRDVTL